MISQLSYAHSINQIEINRHSWQANKLAAVFRTVPGQGFLYYNLRTGYKQFYQPSALYTVPSTGELAASVANSTITHAVTSDLTLTSTDFTVMAWYYVKTAPGNGEYADLFSKLVYVNESNNQGWGLGVLAANDGGGPLSPYGYVLNNNGFADYRLYNASFQVSSGSRWFTAMSSNTSSLKMLLHQGLAQAQGGNLTPAASTGPFYIGQNATTGKIGVIEGRVYLSTFERVWPNAGNPGYQAHWMHHAHRDELFLPVARRTYFFPLAGAGGGARSQVIICG